MTTYNDIDLFPTTKPEGVWIVRSSTLGSVISIHQTELEALRKANQSRAICEFILWGKTLVDMDRNRVINDCSGRNDA